MILEHFRGGESVSFPTYQRRQCYLTLCSALVAEPNGSAPVPNDFGETHHVSAGRVLMVFASWQEAKGVGAEVMFYAAQLVG